MEEPIAVDNEATFYLDGNRVKMQLLKEKSTRSIGLVDGNARCYVKFENENGIHRATNSFSLPYRLLKWLEEKNISGIKIVFAGIHYRSVVKDWLTKGEFLYFKKTTEKKLYLKLSEMH